MSDVTYDYELSRLRMGDAQASSSAGKISQEASLSFRIRVGDELADNCDNTGVTAIAPDTVQVTAAEVMADAPNRSNGAAVSEDDVPKNGLDILFVNGKVFPFMHCASVNCKQHTQATQEFIYTAVFRTETFSHVTMDQLGLIDVPPDLNGYPVIHQTELRLVDYVLYEDNSPVPKQCKLPTGNLFSQPFIQKVPNETKIVTQYELTFSDEIAAERLESVNEVTWLATGDATKWKITDIKWQEVRIVEGPTNAPVALDCFLVEYTVQKLDKEAGWRSRRALLDTHYLPPPATDQSTRQPFVTKEGGRTNYIGQIDQNGLASPNLLVYETFVVQPELDFTTFLRAEQP